MTRINLGNTGIVIEKNGFGCLPIQRISKEVLYCIWKRPKPPPIVSIRWRKQFRTRGL